MTFAVKVAGGTGAGCRHVKERESWLCDCVSPYADIPAGALPPEWMPRRSHSGYRYSCPDCGARNPQCAAPTAS